MLRKIEKNSRTALVTGASSGIGLCMARRLASLGYRVVGVSNQEEKMQEVAHEIAYQHDVDVLPIYIDLAKRDAAEELYSTLGKKGINIDVLINNAGVFIFNPVTSTSKERIENMINLHIHTITMICRIFAEDMIRRGAKGYIMNMSSLAAWLYVPDISLYCATKAYIRSFSKSLHHELKKHGISVTAVCPAGVATDLYRLPERYQKFGVRIGALMSPQRLANKAIHAMFARRECVVPGLINKLLIPILYITPNAVLRWAKNRVSKYEQ